MRNSNEDQRELLNMRKQMEEKVLEPLLDQVLMESGLDLDDAHQWVWEDMPEHINGSRNLEVRILSNRLRFEGVKCTSPWWMRLLVRAGFMNHSRLTFAWYYIQERS